MRGWLLIGCLLLVGCGQIEEPYEATAGQSSIVEQVEQVLTKHTEVEHAHILLIEEQLIVALQVKPWLRFKKSKVEEAVKQALEKRLPTHEATVSSDFKIHWEAGKLLDVQGDKLKKEMEQLRELAKEEA